jgi:hypothetical protein
MNRHFLIGVAVCLIVGVVSPVIAQDSPIQPLGGTSAATVTSGQPSRQGNLDNLQETIGGLINKPGTSSVKDSAAEAEKLKEIQDQAESTQRQ